MIRAPAQRSHPRQCLVRQRVSDLGCASGVSGPKIGSCRSAPRKRPHMCNQAFRGGCSRDLSLQEGRIGLGGSSRCRPKASEPASAAHRALGPSRTPEFSRYQSRLPRCPRIPLAEDRLGQAALHSDQTAQHPLTVAEGLLEPYCPCPTGHYRTFNFDGWTGVSRHPQPSGSSSFMASLKSLFITLPRKWLLTVN